MSGNERIGFVTRSVNRPWGPTDSRKEAIKKGGGSLTSPIYQWWSGTVNPKVVGSSPTIGLFTTLVETDRFQQTADLYADGFCTDDEGSSQVRQTFAHVVIDVRQRRPCFDVCSDCGQQFDARTEVECVVWMGPSGANLYKGAAEGERVNAADPSAGGCDERGA